jgi:hypothetical protein
MKRRHLLKRAVQAAIVGAGGSLSAKGATRPAHGIEGVNSETPATLLDGEWLIATDPQNVGREMRWERGPVPEAKTTRVPSIIQEVFPAYHGVAWYWREFVAPAHRHADERCLIRFGAVDYLADVWVNGVHVGQHEGGETPFVVDAAKAFKLQGSNRLAVRVLNPTNEPIDGIVLAETPHQNKAVPYVNGSGYDRGGILESVEVSIVPGVRIENLYVRPDWKTGRIGIQANLRNATQAAASGHLTFSVAPAATGETLLARDLEHNLPPGDTLIETDLQVDDHRLWDLNDPYLYRVTARVGSQGKEGFHETSVRCGFRDFRVAKGYFRLNGKRLFLRSTHTGNHCPIGQVVPPSAAPDLLRRDLFYAKASGFNTVRFISGIAHPYQLDLCDEIGLLVYEESFAAWLLKDSPKMKERYDFSTREMVRRDRNHPSVVIWGMLNETQDGPVFREAVSALSIVRSLDDTRLVLLGSGRWDGQPSIGSASNPGSSEWDHVWGKEAPGAASLSWGKIGGYWQDSGDAHYYPGVPQTPQVDQEMRTLGQDSKPVFLSEYGIGSLMNAIHETRMYEQAGARPDTEDYVLMRSMAERLIADWNRWGMDGVYPFPEDMLRDSQRRMARHRLWGFDLIRSNPRICGFNLTGMLDHGMTGEGVWKFWRDWKPGAMDAMQDGWWPLRWCLFVEPTHSYAGRAFKVEAVLANEDVLQPGEYPTRLRICGPTGIVWERQTALRIPQVAAEDDGPLAVPVLREEVVLSGPAGVYQLVANMEKGGGPLGREVQFYLSDAAALPRLNQTVTLWGIEPKVENWLKTHEVMCEPFEHSGSNRREIILVGGLSQVGSDANGWKELARRMARGSAVVFLTHSAFQREKDPVAWLPLAKKGRCYQFNDWLYHKECVARAHPIFDGLQGRGILDWYYYGQVTPHHLFDGQETPDDVAAAAFAVGYSTPGGYASGILLGSYRFGEGRFVLNTFPVLENLDVHPAADRLLLNLIAYAAGFVRAPLSELPSGFDAQLRAIGYAQ